MIRTRLRPVPLGGINQQIIAPPRAPVAPVEDCEECPPPGTTLPPIEDWPDLHTLTDLLLDDVTRTGSVYEVTPADTTTTFFIQQIAYGEPSGPIPGLLCVLIPENPAVFLGQLWAVTANGLLVADYEEHFSTRFLTTTYFLSGQIDPYAQEDYFMYSQVLSAYQKDGGIDAVIRFRIKAIQIPAVPLPA